MRILTLCYEFPPVGGGGSRVAHGLARELAAAGHEVDLVTMAYRDLPARETLDGVEIHRVPCLRRSAEICRPHEMLTYLVRALPYARELVRRRRHDVNHTHFIFPDGLVARRLRRELGLPYLVTAHGSDVPGFNPDRFRLLHRIVAPAWRGVVRDAARIVSPSEQLAGLIRRSAPDAPIAVIPNGIALDRFAHRRERRRRILVVTRLFERKGVQHLLRALDGPPLGWEVDVVGEGPFRPSLETQADALATPVRFHGWLDNAAAELRELYETSRIFVFPSDVENFPIVLLEAMSAGLAIVTTRGTGCDAVIGDAGLAVPPRDPAALRAVLERLTADPALCERLGHAARERLERHFGWEAVARRYADELAAVSAPPAEPSPVPALAATA